MRDLWSAVQIGLALLGGGIGWFLGGCDALLTTLLLFMIADYLSGVICAVAEQTLSSQVGFKGIGRKLLILLMVGLANILDVNVIKTGCILRGAVIFFYLSNEGISLLENAARLGLPVPKKLRHAMQQLREEDDDA